MAKKKGWFTLVKRFFFSDSQSKEEKKEKRRKWAFARLRIKRLPSITAPPQAVENRAPSEEAEEKQSNHALTVAIASAAAAEAAVAAAHAAAEVVRLTATPRSTHTVTEDAEKPFSDETLTEKENHSAHTKCEREIQESAAVKIQTSFRGYLARKALRALKGIVTLQAIIRGRAVRRQAVTTLKRLQSIINIQSQVCANRLQTTEGAYNCDGNNQLENLRDKILRMDSFNQRRWDDSLLSKEDADAMFLSKKEAAIKRERIKEYWHSHRKSAESERNKVNGRWRYWLEQWVDTQLNKSKELEDLDTVLGSNTRNKDEFGVKKLRNVQTQHQNEGFMDSPTFVPRKSFHRRQCSLGDENSYTSSPLVPTYMAATESARARARSISSPKLRPESLDGFSPSKNKLSLVSSITSELPISSTTMGRPSDYLHQRSPSMKGVRGPVKSSRKTKDSAFDSEYSLSNWERQTILR